MVASFIEGLKINFGQIIVEELFVRENKTSSALLFLCLITELCMQANVSIIQGVDNEIRATRRQYIEKKKNHTKLEIRAYKPLTFRMQYQPTLKASSGMLLPLTTIVPQGTSVASGYMCTPTTTGTADIVSMTTGYLEYMLTQENFVKMVKAQMKF